MPEPEIQGNITVASAPEQQKKKNPFFPQIPKLAQIKIFPICSFIRLFP